MKQRSDSEWVARAAPGVRGITPYEPGKPLETLAREYGIEEAVKLASNENPRGPSPAALDAARDALAEGARYPDGNAFALRAALARHFDVAPEAMTLGNGSNDVLELIARAFAAPGEEVIFSRYAFAVYPLVTQAIGAKAVITEARDWGCDLEAMAAAVTPATKVIFVANPNNPTGTWVAGDALLALLQQVPAEVLVVVDEAYAEYVDAPGYRSLLPQLSDYPNLVVTRTFSKVYGLAGLRMGVAFSHPEVADCLNRVRQPFNVNHLSQAAAAAALDDQAWVRDSVAMNNRELARLAAFCDDQGLEYIPSVGNFLTIAVGDAAAVNEALLRRGVIVRPMGAYGMPHHLRISVGLPDENDRLMETLKGLL